MESVPLVDRQNYCKMDFFFSVEKVRKYKVGKRGVTQVSQSFTRFTGVVEEKIGFV